ncbi:MAG: class II aldolase/adducin family protein [Planctomycetaceae bacterium]|nr:class II aldolase/adducin family protein [Planctomycetaceae bacterium]
MATNIHKIKQEICEIGRRLYAKGFAAANDGNITYRISENEVLCTPTMICKGFMTPEDICSVDMQGNQLSGRRKRTSEVLLHLEVMKARPDIKSCVHCHPPHATAFAIAREPIPQCVLPEVEVFLGETPITVYETPGGSAFAETVLPFVHKTNVVILANHGTISYGESVERAYWWTEILDAYCRMLMLAKDLGKVTYLNQQKSQELIDLKTKWGWSDPRTAPGMENCDICANDVFRDSWKSAGVERRAFDAPPPMPAKNKHVQEDAVKSGEASTKLPQGGAPTGGDIDNEALVRAITDRVLAELSKR